MFWRHGGADLATFAASKQVSWSGYPPEAQFTESVLCCLVTSGDLSFRLKEWGVLPDIATVNYQTPADRSALPFLAFANSSVCRCFLEYLTPTLNNTPGDIGKLPIKESLGCYRDVVLDLSSRLLRLSMEDWDNSEASWGFSRHPLVKE